MGSAPMKATPPCRKFRSPCHRVRALTAIAQQSCWSVVPDPGAAVLTGAIMVRRGGGPSRESCLGNKTSLSGGVHLGSPQSVSGAGLEVLASGGGARDVLEDRCLIPRREGGPCSW